MEGLRGVRVGEEGGGGVIIIICFHIILRMGGGGGGGESWSWVHYLPSCIITYTVHTVVVSCVYNMYVFLSQT